MATLRLTKSLLDRHGPRIAGTRQCLNAADQIAEMLRVHCDKVVQERFEMHPGSFLNVGRVMALAYLWALIFLLFGGVYVYASLASALFGLVYGTALYVFNSRSFDRWFKNAEGCNVSGVIEPSGEVKQQIILSGHHDSPYVLSFLMGWKSLARWRLMAAVLVYVAMSVEVIASAIGTVSGDPRPVSLAMTGAAAILGLIFVSPLYSVITKLQSPGAGDNLNSTAMAVTVAVHFDLERKARDPLKHTRLVILSTDGEEVGMRGADEYAERHKDELLSTPTYLLNMDSIYSLKDLTFLTKDRNGTVRLSEKMARDCEKIAVGLGYAPLVRPIPPAGGGTDAAAFARTGVEATSIIGISASGIGKETVYHTPHDTVEHIEPEVVEAVLDVAVNYVLQKDREAERA